MLDRRATTSTSPTSSRRCVEDFLLSPSWWPDYCNDDSSVKANFTAVERRDADREHQERDPQRPPGDGERRLRRHRSTRSSCRTTRRRSRTARGFRYSRVGLHAPEHRRLRLLEQRRQLGQQHRAADDQQRGEERAPRRPGCRNITILDAAERAQRPPAVREHGRPARGEGPGHLDAARARSTRPSGSTRSARVSTLFGPYQLQETLHPNYWGQLALRNCVRQAYNGGAPRGGTCTIAGTGLNEPRRAEHGAELAEAQLEEEHPLPAQLGHQPVELGAGRGAARQLLARLGAQPGRDDGEVALPARRSAIPGSQADATALPSAITSKAPRSSRTRPASRSAFTSSSSTSISAPCASWTPGSASARVPLTASIRPRSRTWMLRELGHEREHAALGGGVSASARWPSR